MYQYQVSFGQAISRAFSNYCNFLGRASRSEYWWFYLFTQIVSMVLVIPFYATMISTVMSGGEPEFNFWYWLIVAWGVIVFLPSMGLFFRRLHDTGRSGWWWLLGFIPLVGQIILLVWLCQPSEPGDNRYGPEPNIVTK